MDLFAKKFFIIGLGIGSPSDLSSTALDVLKYVDRIYFEIYTNFTASSLTEYESFLERTIEPVYRSSLENDSQIFLKDLKNKNVALLVSGDPFIATTHYLLFLEAIQIGLQVEIINNVSVYSLVPSILGLSAYKFGKTATIPFQDRIVSDTPYNVLESNLASKSHTILLLDIDLVQDKFLPVNEAINLLLELETKHNKHILSLDTMAIAICKLGEKNSKIRFDSLANLLKLAWKDYGPPQTLVIPGKLDGVETEILEKMWSKTGYNLNFFKEKKKVLVTGTFDVLHPGHLAFFFHAKKLTIPSELWVVVARNSSASSIKKRVPILDENVRLTMIQALQIVDHAVLGNEGPDKIKIIEEIKPDLIVLGYDQWIDEKRLKSELIKRNLPNIQITRLEKFGNDGYASSTEIRKKIATTFMKEKI